MCNNAHFSRLRVTFSQNKKKQLKCISLHQVELETPAGEGPEGWDGAVTFTGESPKIRTTFSVYLTRQLHCSMVGLHCNAIHMFFDLIYFGDERSSRRWVGWVDG